jgi:SAM-dependent methyltransferase
MGFDVVHSLQQLVRGTGPRMRKVGVLPERRRRRQEFEGEQLEEFLAYGRRQTARMQREIESYTGCSLEGRRVLDYGCGIGRTALAMAGQCEYVYGLDIVERTLQKADRTAKEMEVDNVEWLDASRLPELSGRYDAVVSYWVFQHIPTREGERILAAILDGLADGGVGAIHFAVRPPKPLAGLRATVVNAGANPRRKLQAAVQYGYLLMNSYSLNRLGTILAQSGVSSWEMQWWYYSRAAGPSTRNRYPSATLIFRKDEQKAPSTARRQASGAQPASAAAPLHGAG